jgi:hypothetical protein
MEYHFGCKGVFIRKQKKKGDILIDLPEDKWTYYMFFKAHYFSKKEYRRINKKQYNFLEKQYIYN